MRGDFHPAEQTLAAFVAKHMQDPTATALAVIHQLEILGPVQLTPFASFSKPDMLEAWRKGAPIPDDKKDEFKAWLESVALRTEQLGENERRLRSTIWAEMTLRRTAHTDMAQLMAAFHHDRWKLDSVSDDQVEREKQIAGRLRALTRKR